MLSWALIVLGPVVVVIKIIEDDLGGVLLALLLTISGILSARQGRS